jgi:hypothetical protein
MGISDGKQFMVLRQVPDVGAFIRPIYIGANVWRAAAIFGACCGGDFEGRVSWFAPSGQLLASVQGRPMRVSW